MGTQEQVFGLLKAARRRSLGNLLLEQGALAVSAGALVLIALLVLGTQVLAWYWPLVLVAVVLLVGLLRLHGRVPCAYTVAQGIDRRLGLHDLLSTFHHFRTGTPARRPHNGWLELLDGRAARAAAAIHPAAAVPWRTPRMLWPALALLAAAAVLFGIRYGVLRSFDLRAGLIEVRFDTLTGLPEKAFAKKGKPARLPGDAYEQMGMSVDDEGRPKSLEELLGDNALKSIEVSQPDSSGTKSPQMQKQASAPAEEGAEEGEAEEGEDAAAAGDKGAQGADKDQAGERGGKQDKPPQGSREANSLLDKMRDAFANMMDKLKIQQKGDPQQSASNNKQQGGKGQQGEKGTPQKGRQDAQGDPESGQPGDQAGEPSDQAQAGSASQAGQPDPNSNQPKSGVGKSDGSKDTQLAEQLEAMGKISEILGKRAASINGEIMVEVSNTRQQLKTPYVQRNATHTEAGGEIGRDEVPLHLQPFVQQYYEQVRKPEKPAAPAGARK